MSTASPKSTVNVTLQVLAADCDLINEAKNVLLDRTDVSMNAANFQKVLAWLDGEPSASEVEGLKRLLSRR
jgi:uncharacterized protein (DUF1778 family)